MEKVKLEKLVVIKGKVRELEFVHEGKDYKADVTAEDITLSACKRVIVVYDRNNGKTKWPLEHICGASGFGQGYGDSCPACDSKDGFTEEYNISCPSAYGPDTYGMIKGIEAYCDYTENVNNTSGCFSYYLFLRGKLVQ